MKSEGESVNHTFMDQRHQDDVLTDHLRYCISYILCHFFFFRGGRGSILSPQRLRYTAQLSVLTAQPGSLHTVYKLPRDEVLISAEFLSSLEGSELRRESQAISSEKSNFTTVTVCYCVPYLDWAVRWRGEGYTIFLAVGQKNKKSS